MDIPEKMKFLSVEIRPAAFLRSPALAGVFVACVLAAGSPNVARAADTTGLWVGEVVLDRVNEVVVSFDAANRRVATPPETLTPASDQASLRLIVHVDDDGKPRLLKGVAIIQEETNAGENVILLTDPKRFGDYPIPARMIASVAFEFGDEASAKALDTVIDVVSESVADAVNAASEPLAGLDFELAVDTAADAGDAVIATYRDGSQFRVLAIEEALTQGIQTKAALGAGDDVALAVEPVAWRAAVTGLGRLSLSPQGSGLASAIAGAVAQKLAAESVPASGSGYSDAVDNLTTDLTAEINAFESTLGGDAFRRFDSNLSGAIDAVPRSAARAALEAANAASTAFGATVSSVENAARSAALASPDYTTAQRFAHRATLPDLPLSGRLAAGGKADAEIFLGANHPVNPFRHRRHPDHAQGIDLRRLIELEVDTVPGGAALEAGGFGADRLTGTYSEEIFGLHKPLGPGSDVGLRTAGRFTLHRLGQSGILNP